MKNGTSPKAGARAPSRRRFVQGLGLGIAAPLWPFSAEAALIPVRGVATSLLSNNERLISYRHQQHLVQTTDGALHLLYNRGSLTPGPYLSLWSSYDGGINWQLMQTFANTDDKSTGDLTLVGDTLRVVFHTLDFKVMYGEFAYDSILRAWNLVIQQVAYANAQSAAQNPSLAIDELGTLWVGFLTKTRNLGNIRVVNRVGGGTLWTDPNLVFGPTDKQAVQRSARPIRIPGGMGMVWTVKDDTFWSTRTNALPDNSAWTTTTIFDGVPAAPISDPYASHFNVAADASGYLHLITVEAFDVLYFRWSATTGLWSVAQVIDDSRRVAYAQIGTANGKVAAAFSVQRGSSQLTASPDQGASFAFYADLQLPAAYPGANFNTARIELCGQTTGPMLPILQQYADSAGEKLMLFSVPAP